MRDAIVRATRAACVVASPTLVSRALTTLTAMATARASGEMLSVRHVQLQQLIARRRVAQFLGDRSVRKLHGLRGCGVAG